MKIIHKTYFLLAVIIAAASVNLSLLLTTAQENEADSNAIISVTELKSTAERITGLASSIASGNEEDRESLNKRVESFDVVFDTLRNGGKLNGQQVAPVPDQLKGNFEKIGMSWNTYKQNAETIGVESVFNPEVRGALKYVLEKNGELVVKTEEVKRELSLLDRSYNRHKEIAIELGESAKSIGENTLRISIGEEVDRAAISKDRILFEANLRKLLQTPLTGLEIDGHEIEPEKLEPISREDSSALRDLDPLWEAVEMKLRIIESNSLLSKEFGSALNELNNERTTMLSLIDEFVDNWQALLDKKENDRALVVQGLLIGDIGVFLIVLLSIRRSLNPLSSLTLALSRIREGIYGEKIEYKSKDEIGTLDETFNTMSATIKQKEEEAKKIEIAKDEFLAMIT
ncbi:MAG: HAMP domain-containing protein, partial [Nitrososphaerota archaeon]